MREFPVDVEYDERGAGPTLLLLPGSFGTGSGWKAVTDRLARSHRVVTTSLLGYGATAERRPLPAGDASGRARPASRRSSGCQRHLRAAPGKEFDQLPERRA